MALNQLLLRNWAIELDRFDQLHWARVLLALFVIWTMLSWMSGSTGPKASFVGFRFPLEPKFLVRMRFVNQGLKMMTEGYDRVSLGTHFFCFLKVFFIKKEGRKEKNT